MDALRRDGDTYRKLKSDPTNAFKLALKNILDKGRLAGILNSKEYNYSYRNEP